MARSIEPPKPLYPLKHEYQASLDNYLGKVSMLVSSMSSLLGTEHMSEFATTVLKERLAELEAAARGG